MRQWQVLTLALGVAVGAHAWVLMSWGTGQAPRTPNRVKWTVVLAQTPLAAAQPSTPMPTDRPPGAMAAPPAAPQPRPDHAPPAHTPAAEHYWLPHEVDFRAWPPQPPETDALASLDWAPPAPVRLRLAISAAGRVVSVTPLDTPPPPEPAMAALRQMFEATPFMPARRQGRDVASLQDIEILPEGDASGP